MNDFKHRDSIVFRHGLPNRTFDSHHMYMDNTNFMNIRTDTEKLNREDIRFPVSLGNVKPITFNDSNNHIPLQFTDRQSISTRNISNNINMPVQRHFQNNKFNNNNNIITHIKDNNNINIWDDAVHDYKELKYNEENYYMNINGNLNNYIDNKPIGTRFNNQNNIKYNTIELIPNRIMAIPKENIK